VLLFARRVVVLLVLGIATGLLAAGAALPSIALTG
jgi:hypothetical protein